MENVNLKNRLRVICFLFYSSLESFIWNVERHHTSKQD
jgi:hypothetical protein